MQITFDFQDEDDLDGAVSVDGLTDVRSFVIALELLDDERLVAQSVPVRVFLHSLAFLPITFHQFG